MQISNPQPERHSSHFQNQQGKTDFDGKQPPKLLTKSETGFACRARALACIRILVFGLIAFTVWNEDIASSVLLGESFRFPMGVMTPLRNISESLGQPLDNVAVLRSLKFATLALSLMACAGVFRSLTLPLSTLCYLVFAGILREHSHLFHSGLLPLYLAAALSLMPCADAISLDRLRGATEPSRSKEFYGWCRFACWAMIAIVYFGAGYSKLTNGGLMWWSGDNLRQIVLTDCMNPMMFDWDWGIKFKDMPTELFAGMGLSALLIETFYPLVLFNRLARVVFPLGAIGMHLGIFFFQNILFLDLILLQLLFVNWDWVVGKLLREQQNEPTVDGDDNSKIAAQATFALIFFLLLMVVAKIEYYPLTSWQMYSGKGRGDYAVYFRCEEHLSSGLKQRANFEKAFPILRDTRYRDILLHTISSEPERLREFTRRYIQISNADPIHGNKIEKVVLQRRSWSIDKLATDYDADTLIDEVVVTAPANQSAQPSPQ